MASKEAFWCDACVKLETRISHKLEINLWVNYALDWTKMRLQFAMDIRGPIRVTQGATDY